MWLTVMPYYIMQLNKLQILHAIKNQIVKDLPCPYWALH